MRKRIPFKREFILHNLTQKHLKKLFDLEFVASEIQKDKLRLDGLAFDDETNSFVIIEYKNELDLNVLNQVQEYYDLIQNNKEYFLNLLEDRDDVDFDNVRVMIIGPEFSQKQLDEFKDNLELWEVSLFDDGEVTYENLKSGKVRSIHVNLEDLKHTEERLLSNKSDEMKELYHNLKDAILNEFSDIDLYFQVDQFSFRANGKLVCVVRFLKSSFSIFIFGRDLENADRTVDISQSTSLNADYKLKYTSDDGLEYLLDLLRQTYAQKVSE